MALLRSRTSRSGSRRVTRWLATTAAAAVGASLGLAALAVPAQATLSAVGPVDVSTGVPSYYQDATGMRTEPCLDGPPLCFATRADLKPAGGEAFYNRAQGNLTLPGAGKAVLTLSLEAAYAGSGSGQEITFGRVRFTASKGLKRGAAYKVTHPYGVDTFVADNAGAVPANAGTEDIGGLGPCIGPNAHAAGGACDFAEASTSRVGPFLKWDPDVAPAAPAGYLGDNATAHRITGGQNGNVFRVEGPNVNPTTRDQCPTTSGAISDCIETNLFTIEGKEAGPVMSTPAKLAFGSTQLTTSSPAKSVTIKNIGQPDLTISGVSVDPASSSADDFTVEPGTCTTGTVLSRDATCDISVTFTPTAVGVRTATVLVNHDGLRNPERIAITGSAAEFGTAPAVDFSPDALPFGAQRLGTQSAVKAVTINNTGTAALNVSSVALSGADATDFSTQNDCVGRSIAPQSSCKVTVVFAPQETSGLKAATLTITDDAPKSPRTVALSGTAKAGLTDVGPVDADTHFPSYYTDSDGTSLEMCLDGAPNCPTARADLVAPGGEGFYNNATAKLNTRGGGKAVMVLSLEGAYAGTVANRDEIVFSRIRFTDSGGLRANTMYTVTHPFGVDDYTTDSSGKIVKNQGTQDIGGLGPCTSTTAHNLGGVCDFRTAMTGRFGPFLKWAPSANPLDVPPAGFVGDAATDHKITGSPLGTNFVRIEGPNVNPSNTVDACPAVDGPIPDCVQTDLFVVAGKLATTPAANIQP
jgi:hypothetical protein